MKKSFTVLTPLLGAAFLGTALYATSLTTHADDFTRKIIEGNDVKKYSAVGESVGNEVVLSTISGIDYSKDVHVTFTNTSDKNRTENFYAQCQYGLHTYSNKYELKNISQNGSGEVIVPSSDLHNGLETDILVRGNEGSCHWAHFHYIVWQALPV